MPESSAAGSVARDEHDTGPGSQAGPGHRRDQVGAEQHERGIGPLWTARCRLDSDVDGDPGSGGHPEQLVEQLGIRGQQKRSGLSGHRSSSEWSGGQRTRSAVPLVARDLDLWTTAPPVEKAYGA